MVNIKSLIDKEFQELIDKLINERLTEQEGRVIRFRYGLEWCKKTTLRAIGKKMGITCERVRQLEAKALRKMRHPLSSRHLKEYL